MGRQRVVGGWVEGCVDGYVDDERMEGGMSRKSHPLSAAICLLIVQGIMFSCLDYCSRKWPTHISSHELPFTLLTAAGSNDSV